MFILKNDQSVRWNWHTYDLRLIISLPTVENVSSMGSVDNSQTLVGNMET